MSETTVLVGFKVRDYDDPPCFLVGHVMAGLNQVGVDCFEAWGIKDPEPEISRLIEERNAVVLEVHRLIEERNVAEFVAHRLRRGRSTARATEGE